MKQRWLLPVRLKLIIISFVLCIPVMGEQYGYPIQSEGSNLPLKMRLLLPAVARIRFLDSNPSSTAGTGFYIGNGLVITAGHIFAKPGKNGKLQSYDAFNGTTKNISIHFGLTGPKRYFDHSRITKTFNPASYNTPVEVLQSNLIVNEVVDAFFGEDPKTNVARDYAILRINPPWPQVAFEVDEKRRVNVQINDAVFAFGSFEGMDPYFYESKIMDPTGAFLGLERRGGTGFSGGPIVHLDSGLVIGIHQGGFSIPNTDPSSPYKFTPITLAQRIDLAFQRIEFISQSSCLNLYK